MSVLSRLFGTATRSVDAVEARELQRGGAVVVDVRETSEWDAGHIPKAKHHPLRGLPSSRGRLPEGRTLVVVCRSGNRSARATKLLANAGFDAVNLAGGMTAWKAAGLSVVNSRGTRGFDPMNGRALLVSPLGFLIGVSLGALGGGGSILAVPILVYAAGESPQAATTTSLIVVGAASFVGMFAHLRAGRVRVLPGIVFGFAGVGGSVIGTRLNHAVDANVLLLAFAALMLIVAWRMWVNQAEPCTGDEDLEVYPESQPESAGAVRVATRTTLSAAVVVKVLVAGTIVGFITGFFGVGGGFVVVPALVLALGFEMPEAVGTSLLVISINSAVALAGRVGTTTVDWAVAAPFTIAALLGVSVGKSIADRLPTVTLVRWFVGLLVVLAAYVIINAGMALATT